MFGIGYQEMILIGVAALLIFGPGRLPEVASQVGKWVREFRRMSSDLTSEFESAMSEVEDVKRSVQREFGSMSKEVAGVSKSVKKDLPGKAKQGTKAGSAKTGTARAIGAKSTATGTAAKPAVAAKPTAAKRAATGSRAVVAENLPVATKADPLADVSFLDDEIIPAAQNGHAAIPEPVANGAAEIDPAVARMRQRRAAAGYGRRT